MALESSMADGNITLYVTTQHAQEELARILAENAALKREAHTWSKAAETYAASEAKLCEARLAELRYVAEAAQAMRTQLAGPSRADALYELREWALNRQRADVLNERPNVRGNGLAPARSYE